MSHQPLALKYRPATFTDVISQDHVTRTLRNALDSRRIAQAYLFAGPRGSGKTSTARILAKALNCERGITGDPCGACDNCVAITAGRSLDVMEIDAASNRGIDDIKELREAVKYAAAQGRYKVYIVDEVHQLSKDAFNAFLKTLEEPPPGVVFVLATTEPHRILPTILSRCQRFDFRSISLADIRDRIECIAEQESFDLAPEASFAIAKKADGSLRDGLSLLDQAVAFSGTDIDLDSLRRLIGAPPEERYLALTKALVENDTAAALAFVRELRADGYDLEEFYSGLLEHLRSCLLFAIGDGATLAEVPERLHAEYEALATRMGVEDILRMLTLATGEEQIFRRSSQQALVLEVLLVRLALLDRTVDLEAALRALDPSAPPPTPAPRQKKSTQRASRGRAPGSSSSAEPSSGSTGLDLGSLQAAWPGVLEEVHGRRPTVAALLHGVEPMGCSIEEVVLAAPADAEFRLEQLSQRGTLEPLIEVLARRWGFDGKISVTQQGVADDPTPRPRRPTGREVAARDVESRLRDDPKLREVVDLFDASVVRVHRSPAGDS